MKIWQRISEILEKKSSAKEFQIVKNLYVTKYNIFREVLSHNNNFLEMMMNIEEKLHRVKENEIDILYQEVVQMSEEVRTMANKLNQISYQKYSKLLLKLEQINEDIQGCFKNLSFISEDKIQYSEKQKDLSQISEVKQTNSIPIYRHHKIIIEKAKVASKGIGYGKAFILKSDNELNLFPTGAVLVTRYSSARYSTIIKNASAILTEVGAITVHLSAIARELGIPMLVNAEGVTKIIKNGTEITVDAFNGIVYEGKIQELEKYIVEKGTNKYMTDFQRKIEALWKNIMPLNLTDPEGKDFVIENCKTLHDIARYIHQKVMEEIFEITDKFPLGIEYVKLTGAVPLAIYLIDLGEGLSEHASLKELDRQDILSLPFSSFINGMTSIKWPEPRLPDVRGFMGMIAHTASIPEAEIVRMAEKSFAFISKDYMNFSINLGYHLSVIEALTSENLVNNYIRFYFKGGGADFQRRIRRINLISRVLKKLEFNIWEREDIINAILTKDNKESLLKKLDIIGKLTAYTKQLDAVMYDDSSTERLFEEFITDYFPSS